MEESGHFVSDVFVRIKHSKCHDDDDDDDRLPNIDVDANYIDGKLI